MTVYDFCDMCACNMDELDVFSIDGEQTVFSGTYDDAMYSQYADEEVQSFEVDGGKLVLNIA